MCEMHREIPSDESLKSVKRSITFEGGEVLDHTDKAERYWALMLRYHDLAEHAEVPFLRDSYRQVAARYRSMAKEAFDLAETEKQRKGSTS
jgi:hypothetical protein